MEYKEFFKKAYNAINKRFKMRTVPPVLVLIIGAIGSLIARITGIPPKFSYGMATVGNEKQFYSSAKAILEFNIALTPIELGICECLEWFNTNGCLI